MKKTKKQKYSDITESIIIVLILSLLTFTVIDINVEIYLTVAVLLGVLLGSRYVRAKNLDFFLEGELCFCGEFSGICACEIF